MADNDVYRVMDEAMAMLARKGADYATEDRLAQFRRAAADLGLTPRQVWAVYFDKGYAAIRKWVRGGELASEGIRERIVDAIAYLTILSWIVEDGEAAKPDAPAPEALRGLANEALGTLRAAADTCEGVSACDGSPVSDEINEAANTLALVISGLESQ